MNKNNPLLVTHVIQSPIHEAPTDVVELEWFEAAKKLMRKTSRNGLDIAFRLFSEAQALQHHDLIHQSDHLRLRISIKPCQCIVLRPKTLADMAKVCYEIGNKHAPLFIEGEELLMPEDLPLYRWLEAAGFQPTIEERRLRHMLRSNSHSHHSADGDGHDHHQGRDRHPHSPTSWLANNKTATSLDHFMASSLNRITSFSPMDVLITPPNKPSPKSKKDPS